MSLRLDVVSKQNAGGVILSIFQLKLGLTRLTFCMPMGSVVVNSSISQVDPSHHRIRQRVDGHRGNRVAMRAERVVPSIYVTALDVNRMMNHSMKNIAERSQRL